MLDDLFATLQAPLPRTVTQSALSQARQKLKASVFEALNKRLLGSLAALLPEPRWRGLRRVAADSTTLRLPAWPENQAEFGVQSDHPGQPYVLARALGLFATTSRLMLKAVLGRFDEAERPSWRNGSHTLPATTSSSWIAAFPPSGCSPCCNSAACRSWLGWTGLHGPVSSASCSPARPKRS